MSREKRRASYQYLADEDLMVLVGDSDADAFATLYDRHSVSVYSLARKLTREKQAAEDLAQDAFIKVWRLAGSYQARRGGVRTWILTVVRNQGIDQIRARESRRRTLEKIEASAQRSQPAEDFAQAWRSTRLSWLREALEGLPQEQTLVLTLAHFSGLTQAEIAGRLRLPIGTVKSRMRLGLEKLRNHPGFSEMATG